METMELSRVKPSDYELDEKKAKAIEDAFLPMISEREILKAEFIQVVELEICEETCDRAKAVKKGLVKVRKGIEKTHKVQKQFFWQAGKFVDAWKNAETLPVVQMEEKLEGIYNHYENEEKERKAKLLADRMAICEPKDTNAKFMQLGEMAEDVFDSYYDSICLADESRKATEAKIEADRIAAEKAESDERKRVADENAKLKEEADKREAEIKAEREESELKLAHERAELARVKSEADAKETVARMEKEDEAKRAKNKANCKRVNNAILKAIAGKCVSDEAAKALIVEIANGKVPNVSISY